MGRIKASITLSADLDREVRSRGSKSSIINRDLSRLYGLYDTALKQVALEEKELHLVVDALWDYVDASPSPVVWVVAEYKMEVFSFHLKWKVDRELLMQKLKALDDLQNLALVDLAERFYRTGHNLDRVAEITAK